MTHPAVLQLEHQAFVILDGFLSQDNYQALLDLAKTWYTEGQFRTARIGKDKQATLSATIRRDQICWLDETTTHPAISPYYSAIQTLMTALNQAFYLGLTEFETHFSVYQAGDYYRKHVDQFKNTQERRISCVYYLNTNWEACDGGELQLYDLANKALATVSPLGNRFVCFQSDLPHEVLTTQKTRYSTTGWLKTRPNNIVTT